MITELKKTFLRPQVLISLTFAGLLLACGANFLIFPIFFERNYLEWYLSAGPMIALATAAFGAAWGSLDKNPALISANPLTYFGACLQVAGLPPYSLGAHLKSGNRVEPVGFEVVPVSCLAFSLTIAIFAWLFFIVPAQYFLFLVTGSLSRIAQTSTAQTSARIQSGQVEILESGPDDRPMPEEGWWDASLRNKPVTLASAFGAAILFLLHLLWNY